MDYLEPEAARDLRGLRLVLTAGVPGPWGESAKAILRLKHIPFIPVAQSVAEPNETLVAWTGLRNAPIVVLDNERPIDRWLDILTLAERLAPEPALLPAASAERAAAIGIAHEICGEWGLAWCRRCMMVGHWRKPDETGEPDTLFARSYRVTQAAIAAAPQRVAEILGMLAERLAAQRRAGSDYLVGDRFSAADLYWSYFSLIVAPLPPEHCPMPGWLRRGYEAVGPMVAAALDPALIAHRDLMFARHLGLPMDF